MAGKKTEPVIKDSAGKEYTCSIPQFNFNNQLHTAEELAGKPKLVDELVKIGFGGLTENK